MTQENNKLQKILVRSKYFSEEPIRSDVIDVQLKAIRDCYVEVAKEFPKKLSELRELMKSPENRLDAYKPVKVNIPKFFSAEEILEASKGQKLCGYDRHRRLMATTAATHTQRGHFSFQMFTKNSEASSINDYRHMYRRRCNLSSSNEAFNEWGKIVFKAFVNDDSNTRDLSWVYPAQFDKLHRKIIEYGLHLQEWRNNYEVCIRRFYHLDEDDQSLNEKEEWFNLQISQAFTSIEEGYVRYEAAKNGQISAYKDLIYSPEIEDHRIMFECQSKLVWTLQLKWLQQLEQAYDNIIRCCIQYLDPILDGITPQKVNVSRKNKNS